MGSGRRLVVVDLDGTLIAGNSLHVYLKCGVSELLRTANFASAAKVLSLMALRLVRFISHRRMKFAALSMIPSTEAMRTRFVARIKAMRRPEVEALIKTLRESGCEIILATAAADTYVDWIWHDRHLATPMQNNPKRVELRGENKRDAVLAYVAQHSMSLHAVITDHADDLALLMCGADQNILVHPTASTIAAARMAGVTNLRIIAQ